MSSIHRAPTGAGTPFGAAKGRFLARWLGMLCIFGAITGGASLLFPAAAFADVPVAAVSASAAGLAGLVLLSGALDRAPSWIFPAAIGLITVVAALGSYGGGSPEGGGELFFLWISPYAFAFFSARQAAAQATLVAVTYGTVLGLQHHQHPAIGSTWVLVGLWMILVASVLAIGLLVRYLATTVRDVDLRFRRGFEDSPVAAAFLDVELHFVEVNDALCALLGRDAPALIGLSVNATLAPGEIGLPRWLGDEAPGRTVEDESRLVRADGTVVDVEVASSLVTPEIGPAYWFLQLRDVTDLRRDREALAHNAIHDPLTGLYNRALLLDRATMALHGSTRKRPQIAMILLDIDQFKVVNDSLGHEAGDLVLTTLAPRLAAALEPGDTLARLGGDEFVVLCDGLHGPLDAVDRAGRLADSVATPMCVGEATYVASASIGVAVAGADHDAVALLRDADAAMNRAKAAGRNRIEVFDRSMRDEAVGRLQLESDLRSAIREGLLVLEYQPVVEAGSGRPVSLEALVRWDHPQRGRIGPDEFVPLAERTGLIIDLGDWVLRTAVAQLATWQLAHLAHPPLKVTVNVSGHQLAVPGFCVRLAEMLRRSAVAPGSVGLEITESVIIDVVDALETIESIKQLGVSVLLDDFGTGYSSLAYLDQFPIDVVKIDRSFVARLDQGADRSIVLEAIVAMARALQIEVIAEGVESDRQIHQLRALGCTWLQGYAVARPLPAADVLAFLAERATVASALEPRCEA